MCRLIWCRDQQRPEEGIGFAGVGVTGGCVAFQRVLETKLESSARAQSTLNC